MTDGHTATLLVRCLPSPATEAARGETPMRRLVRKLFRSQSGQGMTEYLIIVALIAVAAVGVVTVFGNDIRQLFSAATGTLSGQSTTANTQKAAVSTKSLKNFGTFSSSGD
jgi:pilus assembly protein Flp/PilA